MTQKHNFIFKTVTCLIMASAIFVLTSFVLPDTNVVEAKQLSCISYESPAPATDAEAKESNIEKAKARPQVEKESVDVNTPAIPYTEEDLDLLARLITAEMGASWVSDEMQLYVGSVVINRMNHELFPDISYDRNEIVAREIRQCDICNRKYEVFLHYRLSYEEMRV